MKRLLEQPDNFQYNDEGIKISDEFSAMFIEFIGKYKDCNPVDLSHILRMEMDYLLHKNYLDFVEEYYEQGKRNLDNPRQ